MKIQIGAALVLLLSFAGSSYAGPGGCTNAGSLFPFAFEEIDVSSTAKGFTSTVAGPSGQRPADLAICYVEDDAIRTRADGLAPSATVGQVQAAASYFTVCGEAAIKRVRMIRVTTDADVSCEYYRMGDQ
jgi:hypothetical protein